MAESMKIRAFWDVAPCTFVEADRYFRGAYLLHLQGDIIALMMEAVHASETSVCFHETTWPYIPKAIVCN
jgi:hypothetical protein